MKTVLVLTSVVLGVCLGMEANLPRRDPGARPRHGGEQLLLARAHGTPTPAPTPKYKIMNFGGVSGEKK
jgi:hypothetical protein